MADEADFKLWKPTWRCHLRRLLLSESLAWAVQNAVGVFFTLLFVVFGKMTFTLACVAACLYSAGSQVLSLDRTIGGRMFGGVVFLGCMLSAGLLGGSVSSLAWLAHGSASGLIEYLSSAYQKIPNRFDLGLLLEYFPKVAALPLPQFARDEVTKALDAIGEQVPEISAAFWVLLIVLYMVVSLPFAVARSSDDMRMGIFFAIGTLFLGSQVVFASLMPTLGLRLYWTQITLGYVKVALVNAGAMILTGMLLLSTSAYDAIRLRLGKTLQETGVLLSSIGTTWNRPCDIGASAPPFLIHSGGVDVAAITDEEILQGLRRTAHMKADAAAEVETDRKSMWKKMPVGNTGSKNFISDVGEDAVLEAGSQGTTTAIPNNVSHHKSGLQLQGDLHELEDLFSSATFEPPLPGLVSQPGSSLKKYKALHRCIAETVSIQETIGSAVLASQYELVTCCAEENGNRDASESASAEIKEAISFVLASCSAACADVSVVLRHMPFGTPCYGNKLVWRPESEKFWSDMTTRLDAAAERLPILLPVPMKCSAADRVSSTLVMLTGCEILISKCRKVQTSAAAAIGISVEMEEIEELNKEKVATGDIDAEPSTKVERKPGPSLKERILGNPYGFNVIVLAAMSSGIAMWAALVKTLIEIARGSVEVLRARRSLRSVLSERNVQFALKFWMAMTLTIMGIVLILWKGEGSTGVPTSDAYNITYFFFVWQPIYFWITAAICIQKQVEAAASRAVLRALFTAIGGVLGYCTMLNGSLANNPYFITAITCVFNGACGLLSPIKKLRYSLFLAAFTFNGVVVCQYFGCCDVPGDPKVFGGKVLSTLFGAIYAILVSWCITPFYTSEVMLRHEAHALQCGIRVLGEMRDEVDSKASEDEIKDTKKDWDEVIESGMHAPMGLVRKELELNTIDRDQLHLTWLLLPTPRLVEVLMHRIAAFATLLEASNSVLHSSLWPGAPSSAQAALLEEIRPCAVALILAAQSLGEAAAECMGSSSHADVSLSRTKVAETVSELEVARARLRRAFVECQEHLGIEPLQASDLRFFSWKHLLLQAVQELQVLGIVLSETNTSLDRDRYFAWLSTWFGWRPFQ